MSVSYRRGTLGDIRAIDTVFRDAFCDTFAHLYSAEDLRTFLAQFSDEAWAGEIGDKAYAFCLAEDGGRAVGFVKIGPSTLPVDPAGPAIELRQIYVLRPYRGTGIAAHLTEWALAEARERGAEEIYLTVYTDNPRARRFYERYNFEYVGPYKFMVGDHADEDIIMRLKL